MSSCTPDDRYLLAGDRFMMGDGESREEAFNQKVMFTHPKAKLRVGCWNVRTMYAIGKTAQVCSEMRNYRLDVLGVSECRWMEFGKLRTQDGELILFSGSSESHQHGVAIILGKE